MEEKTINTLEVITHTKLEDNAYDLLECYRYVRECATNSTVAPAIGRYARLMQGYIDGTSMCSNPEVYIDDAYRVATVLDSNPLERREADVLGMYRLAISMGVISMYLHGLDGTKIAPSQRRAAEKASDRYKELR